MIIVGIDGGCGHSAAVVVEYTSPGVVPRPIDHVYLDNISMVEWLWNVEADLICIEAIMSNGGAGSEVIQTAYWNGRFWSCIQSSGKAVCAIDRRTIKRLLFGKASGNDSAVMQHVEDIYGGRKIARGTKRKPGILYGIAKHEWQAFGVVIACINALESGNAAEFYWDELYTEKELFRGKKVERRTKRDAKTLKKAQTGRTEGALFDKLKNRDRT